MKCVVTALSVAFFFILSGCQPGPEVLSPTEDGIVIGDTVKLIVRGMTESASCRIYLDDSEINPDWQEEAYVDRWITDVELPFKGPHVLRLESCLGDPGTVKTVSFRNDLTGSVEAADLISPMCSI